MFFEPQQLDDLKRRAAETGVPIAAQIRRMTEVVSKAEAAAVSGAVLLGLVARTTSGDVWIGRAS